MSGSVIDFSALRPATPPPLGLHGFRPEMVGGVRHAAQLLAQHGAVGDGQVWPERHLARWRAQRLIDLMEQMGLRQRWELRQRVWAVGDGFQWAVQLTTGGESNGRTNGTAHSG
jgi:hypothetical protein